MCYVFCDTFVKDSRRTEMVKEYECPVCEKNGIKIHLSNGYEAVFDGKLSELPCSVFCKNCRRQIKYAVVKEIDDQQK